MYVCYNSSTHIQILMKEISKICNEIENLLGTYAQKIDCYPPRMEDYAAVREFALRITEDSFDLDAIGSKQRLREVIDRTCCENLLWEVISIQEYLTGEYGSIRATPPELKEMLEGFVFIVAMRLEYTLQTYLETFLSSYLDVSLAVPDGDTYSLNDSFRRSSRDAMDYSLA